MLLLSRFFFVSFHPLFQNNTVVDYSNQHNYYNYNTHATNNSIKYWVNRISGCIYKLRHIWCLRYISVLTIWGRIRGLSCWYGCWLIHNITYTNRESLTTSCTFLTHNVVGYEHKFHFSECTRVPYI